MDPVKGTYCLEPRRLRSCSDTRERKRSHVVCFSRIWSVPFEAWRTGSPCFHLEHASASSGLPSGLDLPMQIAIRPTDFCHPTNLSTCTRARGSRPTSRPRGMSPVARWIEGHDVSRRRRPLPPDRTLRPRVFTGVASCDRASDTPVARSWGRAALLRRLRLRSLEPRPPSPCSVKKKGDRTIRCAFLRQDARATERLIDPDPGLATWVLSVNVHGVVRPTITSSSRAPGRAPCDAVREVHPRPSPRLPVCCPTRCHTRRCRAPG